MSGELGGHSVWLVEVRQIAVWLHRNNFFRSNLKHALVSAFAHDCFSWRLGLLLKHVKGLARGNALPTGEYQDEAQRKAYQQLSDPLVAQVKSDGLYGSCKVPAE